MSFNITLFKHIKSWASVPARFYYGSAVGSSRPFYTMLPVGPPNVQPVSMCESQGGQGITNFQFSISSGSDAGSAEEELQALNAFISDIIGEITYNTEKYDIWENITTGVNALGGADLNTWDAVFDVRLQWKRTQ